ncbi:MAG: guanylate kinase [Deltaproteobacteria bacterium]|nr:guanylate kinase [Deltaproteobacteria bacterium]MBW2137165.1 guanylate kinase [Deltaproteobacteria bacterium]
MAPHIFVISGPSGVGKSTILNKVMERVAGLGYTVSHTSRPPRNNEVDGKHYHFVSREEFRRMVEQGAFVEWAQVYDDYYGTSIKEVKEKLDRKLDVVMDIDPQGARNIRGHFKGSLLIYVLPPSLEELERRLKGRATDDKDVIESRLERALKEMESCAWYDFIVFNRELDDSVRKVESIILSERCRSSHQLPRVEEVFKIKVLEDGE